MTIGKIEMGKASAMRTKIIIGAAALVLAVVATSAVVVYGASKSTAPAPAAPVPALTVTAAAPHRVIWSTAVEVPGAIAPWQEASISAQISGYQLTDVLVNVGDQVKKGQVLARINPDLLRADEAMLLAGFEEAQANYKRALALKANGFISEQNILQLETQMKTTKAQLDAKRLQIRYTDVIAPDDGAISARSATLGSVATAGQELFRLVRQNKLEWRGELSARQLAMVRAGQAVRLTLPNDATTNATVRQSAPTLNADRLGIVYADIETNSAARAGMYARGRIEIGAAPALAVPAEAVVLRDGRTYVFALGAGETSPAASNLAKVALQAVEVGRREGAEIEIVSGLGADTKVAIRGSGFLNDGDLVRVVAADAAPARGINPGRSGNQPEQVR